MTLSYLVSTAGHAQHQNDTHPHEIQSILQLITEGAKEFQDEKVVGFTSNEGDRWVCERYSYNDLLSLAAVMEVLLHKSGIQRCQEGVVSLLCPTGLDFLVAWIALMQMGYGVVFTAPQCSPSAVSHLTNSSSSSFLIYHHKYSDLAHSARPLSTHIPLVELPPLPDLSSAPSAIKERALPYPNSVSHIFHTSGTSGTPKPIPHTNYQSVAPLPRRALPSYLSHYASGSGMAPAGSAAFTTTPLFHGGVSDLLRAWMARSMIYFYPTSDTPITVSNVVQAVEQCNGSLSPPPLLPKIGMGEMTEDQVAERMSRFRVIAFLSVPYILTILAEDPEGPGMKMMKEMELVSTGGAPLDTEVGNRMVKSGVRLVSRLGSSECGFLLSSHRDYHTESDWEWLRNDSPYADALVFEPTEDEKFEMVVSDRWLSKTKSNRDDGSYATGDLYEPHKTKPGVWRYVGKGDDVLVLSNGEKAAPGPIESILRSSPLISDALVVGADQSMLGVLLFPRSSTPSSSLMQDISSHIKRANSASPSFAQISTEMCLVIDNSKGKELPKSSKGTVQRGLANDLFKEEIKSIYGGAVGSEELPKRSLQEIEKEVERIIVEVTSSRVKVQGLEYDTDLFSWGVDSLMATRIRSGIMRNLNVGNKKLGNNVVFEKPSIKRLSQHIHDLQENHVSTTNSDDDALQLMRDLATKYGTFDFTGIDLKRHQRSSSISRTFLLTGATGSLGTYLLRDILSQDRSNRVICLVRAGDDKDALRRVQEAMKMRGLEWDQERVSAYTADLSAENLKLGKSHYEEMVAEVDIIIHAAWPVHFASSLVSFDSSIKGTHNLINLISQTHSAKLYFCSSFASVLNNPPSVKSITETPSDDPKTATSIGYSQSKWVTEQVCLKGDEALKRAGLDRGVTILRVGQLCGDTESGRWNEKEGWPLLIRTAEVVGCLPELDEEPSWLPVDIAAKTIVDIATSSETSNPIYHVAHPSTFTWSSILTHLKAAGLQFDRVQPGVWLEKMEKSEEDLEKNPSRGMLDMWTRAYGSGSEPGVQRVVETPDAQAASSSLREVEPINENLVKKMVRSWRRSGFLSGIDQ